MKQLSESDIENMIGDDGGVITPASDARKIRAELKLSKKIPERQPVPEHITIDFHNHTEDEAWQMIMSAALSGARCATVITGASGILRPKFIQWVHDSIFAPYVVSCTPINNGSFAIKFKKNLKEF
ncbi:MAG: Smr/MutS family protein [Proteobacteria bacterium]|nr:Smr/MutS family protein [Candidatus Enterousia scatequi]